MSDDISPEIKEWVDRQRENGASDEEILERVTFLQNLSRAEHLGLIELVERPDGWADIYERDPFEDLPVTD